MADILMMRMTILANRVMGVDFLKVSKGLQFLYEFFDVQSLLVNVRKVPHLKAIRSEFMASGRKFFFSFLTSPVGIAIRDANDMKIIRGLLNKPSKENRFIIRMGHHKKFGFIHKERLAQMAKFRKPWKNKGVRILSLLLLFSLQALAALSLGDGSDGVCSWTSTQTVSKNSWNCQSINVSVGAAITFPGSGNVVLRSQGPVTIDGDLDVSAVGQSAGPGGGDGGLTSSQDGTGFQNGQGLGGGDGIGAGGGGGGGGGAGHLNPGVAGIAGTAAGGGAGSSYGDESNFQNTIYGGSGGGAGGDGQETGAGSGGPGGGGGGAITIIAKELINITGNVFANGAAGSAPNNGGTFAGGAGGGGGSGGSIYLVSLEGVTITGSLSVAAGGGGAGGAGSGAGSAGSEGRARLDAPSGAINTGGGSIPGSAQTSAPPSVFDPLEVDTKFESDIAYACSYKEIKRPEELLLQAFIGLLISFLVIGVGRTLLGLRYRQH